jgi:Raf kinase inhibitor-like YbhB/YbcL family protein
MIITSPSFEEGGTIPKKFTCDGGDINPELLIQNVPPGTKSLALIMYDPDAPVPGGFTHWVVWNISPGTGTIKQESIPPGASEGMNSKAPGYAGPCTSSGTHHYEFHLYALDGSLELPASTGREELAVAMHDHIVEEAVLVGLYARQPS